MKNAILLAAGALLGSASAGVHKMKLQKVPLSEQLVSFIARIRCSLRLVVLMDLLLQEKMDINTHVKALGQKYMGIRPESHRDEMFKDTSIHADKGDGHPVPVSNFLNAQCMCFNIT